MQHDDCREHTLLDSLFDVNELNFKVRETTAGNVYFMDDFYKHPDKVVRFINSHDTPLWNVDPSRSRKTCNGKFFEEKRNISEIWQCRELISKLCRHLGEKHEVICGPKNDTESFLTHDIKFIDQEYNDYENFYWWPQRNPGCLTGLVYLDSESDSGTNLYEMNPDTKLPKREKHEQPWRPKEDWRVLHSIEPKYNRLVVFDGDVYHGMDITSDIHFEKRRLNQVLLLRKPAEGKLYEFQKFVDPNCCDEICACIPRTPTRQNISDSYYANRTRNIHDFEMRIKEKLLKIENDIFMKVQDAFNDTDLVIDFTDVVACNDKHIMPVHADAFDIKTGKPNECELKERIYTAVLYLNEDFVGGETYFPLLFRDVTPEKGKLAIYPSDLLHQHGVRKVLLTDSTKPRYTFAMWFKRPKIKIP